MSDAQGTTREELLLSIAEELGGRRRKPGSDGGERLRQPTGSGTRMPYDDEMTEWYSASIPEGQYRVGDRPQLEEQLAVELGYPGGDMYEFLTQSYNPEETRAYMRPSFVPGEHVSNEFIQKLLAQAGYGLPSEPQGVEGRGYR